MIIYIVFHETGRLNWKQNEKVQNNGFCHFALGVKGARENPMILNGMLAGRIIPLISTVRFITSIHHIRNWSRPTLNQPDSE